MKKRVIALALILALALSMTAYAVEPRDGTICTPVLSFDGTTANCSVTVVEPGADIEVTLRLYRGVYCLRVWSGSGTDYVKVSGTHDATAGTTYRLVASGTIDGVAFTSQEVVGTCGG